MDHRRTLQVITLSNHTDDKLREAQEVRAEHNLHQLNDWKEAMGKYDAARSVRQAAARRTWRSRRMGAWVLAVLRLLVHVFCTRPPARPRQTAKSDQEQVWAAGHEGEEKVQAHLMRQLGPDWVALAGYKNGKGEADLLVIGPPGILGIEVKHIAGVVHVHGGAWMRDRYDRYGNYLGRNEPIRDRGGRSPAAQINGVLEELANFLAKRQQHPTILRAVVLTHPTVRLGSGKDESVHFVGTVSQLEVHALFDQWARHQASLDVQRIVALITKDHAWHARRLGGPGRAGGLTRTADHSQLSDGRS